MPKQDSQTEEKGISHLSLTIIIIREREREREREIFFGHLAMVTFASLRLTVEFTLNLLADS